LKDEKIPSKFTNNIFLKGTFIAIIITIPSLTAFFIGWYILDDLILSAIIGVVIHFIAMIVIFKFSKQFFMPKS